MNVGYLCICKSKVYTRVTSFNIYPNLWEWVLGKT